MSFVYATRRDRRQSPEQRQPLRAHPPAQEPRVGTVDDLYALIESSFRAGVIAADPPLRFGTWSPAGEGRSAGRHYRTETRERLKALPIGQLAARDCALFLWTLRWAEDWAAELVSAWGFRHVSRAFTWVKTNKCRPGWHVGMGYGTRANPEACWLCTRGRPRRLARDVPELIVAPVGRHSEKPEDARARMERLYAGPYLELFARRLRPGWVCWGDELPAPTDSRANGTTVGAFRQSETESENGSRADRLRGIR